MRASRHRHLRQLLPVCCCLIACSTRSIAQASRTTTLDFATASEFEDYLRVLQVAGLEPLHPWSIRAFSPRTITRFAMADSVGPWALRQNFREASVEIGSLVLGSAFNSAGVRNYASLGQGIQATIDTLRASGYGYEAILSDLAASADPYTTAGAINASSWCHGCAGGNYVIGLIPAVEAYYGSYAAN